MGSPVDPKRAVARGCAALGGAAALLLGACSAAPRTRGGGLDAGDGGTAADSGSGAADTGRRDAVTLDAPFGGPCVLGDALPPGDHARTVSSGGREREYLVHVPVAVAGELLPVVLGFHGFLSDAESQAETSHMLEAADARGFLAVHPRGVNASWNGGACCGVADLMDVDDVQFVRDLLADLAAVTCVDPGRVFATGLSNGAFLTSRLACELSDRIAAFAPVAGTEGVEVCAPTRAVSILRFHGTEDGINPFEGAASHQPIGAEASFAAWAARNGCVGEPVETYAVGDVRCTAYRSCSAGTETELCVVTGGGHQWPGGETRAFLGENTTDISATEYMLDFFLRHALH